MIKNMTYLGDKKETIQEEITIIYTRPFAIKKNALDLFAVICNIFHEINDTFTIFEYPPTMISQDQQFQIFSFENNDLKITENLMNISKQYIEEYLSQKKNKKKNANYDSFFFVRFTSRYDQVEWQNKIQLIRSFKHIMKQLINQYLKIEPIISNNTIKIEEIIYKFKEELRKEDQKQYKSRQDDIILIL